MSSSNMIVLKSSDGEIFEVEEAVALESQRIKWMIEHDCFDRPLPDHVKTKILSIGDVTSKILSMVIEYCKKHVDTPAEDLKSFDSDLVKVDQGTLFDLILAANSLDIKSLLDVAYQAVGDMIKGKTAEEIRMTFNIENDFTPEEEEEVYMETEGPPFELINLGQKQVSLDDPQTSKRMRMSEYIVSSSHQKEIMIRLPVASVLECRRVSKAWKSLIDSPQFITAHSHHRRTHSRLLLVSNLMSVDADFYHHDVRYLSIRDDDPFPHQQSKLTPPFSIGELYRMGVVGSSHGLMCLYAYSTTLCKLVAVLWNPTIRKTVVVPYHPTRGGRLTLGFGVCPVTGDPKLLMVNYDERFAKLFTLSSQKWRFITMPPRVRTWEPTTTDKFIYSCTDFDNKKLVSFDLTHETYKVTDLPKYLTSFKYTCKIGDSFAMVVPDSPGKNASESCSVWIFNGDGAQTPFSKLYNITCSPKFDRILASRTNGKLIMLRGNPTCKYYAPPDSEPPSIAAYAPTYDEYYPLPIDKFWYDIHVEPYEQTLLLLDCHATLIEGGCPGTWDNLSFF